MKRYSQNKFQELSTQRQVRIVLNTIYRAEQSWCEPQQKMQYLEEIKNYFQWIDFYEQKDPILNRLSTFQFKLDESLSLRSLLDLAVPLERYLNLSIKDEHLVKVKEGDSEKPKGKTFPLVFVLDHLRSAFNVGSLFRTAECLGVEHLYLVGYTPTPDDQGVKKTAMGTESLVSWSQHNHFDEVIEILEKKNIQVVALETVEGSLSLEEFKAPQSLALVVGNERFGLSIEDLARVGQCIEIPMQGQKSSLNVANSLSIATFEVIRQWMKS